MCIFLLFKVDLVVFADLFSIAIDVSDQLDSLQLHVESIFETRNLFLDLHIVFECSDDSYLEDSVHDALDASQKFVGQRLLNDLLRLISDISFRELPVS